MNTYTQVADSIVNIDTNDGNLHIHNTSHKDFRFEKRNWEQLQKVFEAYPAPDVTGKMLDLIVSQEDKNRVWVMGGRGDLLGERFPIYLGYKLAEVLGAKEGDPATIYSWNSETEFFSVSSELEQKSKPAVFLLPNVSQRDANFLDSLNADMQQNGGYLIMWSYDADKWNLHDSYKRKYLHIFDANEPVYSLDTITTCLVDELTDQAMHERFIQPVDRFEVKTQLDEGLTLEALAQKLHNFTPRRVKSVVDQLQNMPGKLDREQVVDIVNQQQHSPFESWLTRKEPREELIVLGALLLQGLDEDQFFQAMKILIDEDWHWLDETLRAFDYFEFKKIKGFFYLDGEAIYSTLSRDNFGQIIKNTFWFTHRRHIRSALETLSELVHISGTEEAASRFPDLLGSAEKQNRFRHEIGRLLGEISLISKEAVENIFLSFVLSPRKEVQEVAAAAMGFWYTKGEEEKIFQTFEEWRAVESEILKRVKRKKKKTEEVERKHWQNAAEAINSTYALALGRLSELYPENQLSDKIYSELKSLADKEDQVKDRLEGVVPQIVARHIIQFFEQGYIAELLKNYGFLAESLIAPYDFFTVPPGRRIPICRGGLAYVIIHTRKNKLDARIVEFIHQVLLGQLDNVGSYRPLIMYLYVFHHMVQAWNWDGMDALVQRTSLEQENDLMSKLAIAVAHGASKRPDIAEKFLDHWYGKATEGGKNKGKKTYKALAIWTYSHIDLEKGKKINVEQMFQRLAEILKTETRDKQIRNWATNAVKTQVYLSFPIVKNQLSKLLVQLSLQEQAGLNSHFFRRFLVERGRLTGGDMKVRYLFENNSPQIIFKRGNDEEAPAENILPLWVEEAAPTTEIERALTDWLKGASQSGLTQTEGKVLSQIGAKAHNYLLTNFYKAEDRLKNGIIQSRRKRANEMKERAQSKPTTEPKPISVPNPEIYRPRIKAEEEEASWFMRQIIAYMVRQKEPALRPILSAILPIYLKDINMTNEDLRILAQRLNLNMSEGDFAALPKHIRNAKSEYDRLRSYLWGAGLLAVFILFWIILS